MSLCSASEMFVEKKMGNYGQPPATWVSCMETHVKDPGVATGTS